jgi:hypothetical protein
VTQTLELGSSITNQAWPPGQGFVKSNARAKISINHPSMVVTQLGAIDHAGSFNSLIYKCIDGSESRK